MFKRLSFFIFTLFLTCLAAASTVDIFHTSDVHGFYFPREINGRQTGGYAALAALLKEQKNPYLLLDSGDFTSGTYEAKQSNGNLSVQFMNRLGYHATTIGNHENDFKKQNLTKNLNDIEFDILAANVFDTKTKQLFGKIKPFKIYTVNGKKIAVIGLGKEFSTKADGINISGTKKALKKALYQVKQQNPDAIILLTHSSLQDDKHGADTSNYGLIKDLEGINVVLGGHAHKVFQNVYKDGVLFAESGTALTHATHIVLEFDDETGKFVKASSEYIKLNAEEEDPEVKAFAEANRAKELDEKIGYAAETIYLHTPKDAGYIDSPLGNIFADLLKKEAGADIGVQNTGGVREDLKKGIITGRNIYQIAPFPNKPYLIKANGAFIKKFVLKNLKKDKSLFQYSGLEVKYRFKHNRPELVSLKINGQELDPDKTYTIATIDFIAKGNSEGYMFKNLHDKTQVSNKLMADLFKEYIKANPQGVKPAKNGRIIKVD